MKIINKNLGELYDLLSTFDIQEDEKIMIKPNIVSPESYPTTTDPNLLDLILEILKNSSKIEVADGPAPDHVFIYRGISDFNLDANASRKAGTLMAKFWRIAALYMSLGHLLLNLCF